MATHSYRALTRGANSDPRPPPPPPPPSPNPPHRGFSPGGCAAFIAAYVLHVLTGIVPLLVVGDPVVGHTSRMPRKGLHEIIITVLRELREEHEGVRAVYGPVATGTSPGTEPRPAPAWLLLDSAAVLVERGIDDELMTCAARLHVGMVHREVTVGEGRGGEGRRGRRFRHQRSQASHTPPHQALQPPPPSPPAGSSLLSPQSCAYIACGEVRRMMDPFLPEKLSTLGVLFSGFHTTILGTPGVLFWLPSAPPLVRPLPLHSPPNPPNSNRPSLSATETALTVPPSPQPRQTLPRKTRSFTT